MFELIECLLVPLVIGSLFGSIVATVIVGRSAGKRIAAARRRERAVTWRDCVRFHRFDDQG
jgi:hypothetical protein